MVDTTLTLERIQREGTGWSYIVDATRLPNYLYLSLCGLVTPEATAQYRRDVMQVYRLMMDRGLRNAPVFADYHALDVSNWSIFRAARVHGGVFHPNHRIVVIPSQQQQDMPMIAAINRFITTIYSNLDIVSSVEEAISALKA